MKCSLLSLCLILFSLLGTAQSKNFIDQPFIEVNGTADSLVTPDEIFIKITISENDNKGKVSVEELESKMIEAFKRIGIQTETDLSIDDISSNFRFYFLKKADVFKSKQYDLKVNSAKTAGKVFSELQNLSISNAAIERISHTNLEEIKNAVRSKAVENAGQKAIALTKPLNQHIGPAIHIVDFAESGNELQGKVAGFALYEVELKRRMAASQDTNESNLDFRKIKISAGVNIKFILK